MRKTCSKCGKSRRLKFFSKDVRYRLGVKGWCKKCELDYSRKPDQRKKHAERWNIWIADPENRKTYNANRTAKRQSPEAKRKLKDSAYQRDYGITLSYFESRVKKQKGRCKMCKRKRRLCADHCHKTKKFRGAICFACNHFVGYFETIPNALKNVLRYLGREK